MYQIRSPQRSHTLSQLETASEAPNCKAMTSCSENQISASHSEFQNSIGCYDFSEEKIDHSEDLITSSQQGIHQNNPSGIFRNRKYVSTLTDQQQGANQGVEEQSRYYFASNTSNNAGSECEQELEQNSLLDNRKNTHRRQNQAQIGISNFLSHPQSAYCEESINSAGNDQDLLNQNLNHIENNNNSFSMIKAHHENSQNGKASCDIVTATAVDERISSNEVDDICTDSPSSSSSSGSKQDEFIVKVPEVKLEKFELDKQALLQSMEGLLKNYQNTSKESLKIQSRQQQSLEKANILQLEQLNEIKMLKKKLTLKTEQLQTLYDWKKKTQLELKKYKKEGQKVGDADNCTSQRIYNKIGEKYDNSKFWSDRKIDQGIRQEFKQIACCAQCNEVKLKRLELEEEIRNVYHDQFQIEQEFEEIIQGKDEAIANLQIQVENLGNDLEIKKEQSNQLLQEINAINSSIAQQTLKNSVVNRIDKGQDQDRVLQISEEHQNSLEFNVCLQQKLNELLSALQLQQQADAAIITSRDKTIENLKQEQQKLIATIEKLTEENAQLQLICQQKSDEVAFLQQALEEKSIENDRLVLKIEEIHQKGLKDDSYRRKAFEEDLRRTNQEGLIKEQRLNIEIQKLVQLNEKQQLDIEDLHKEIERLKEYIGKLISSNEETRKEEELKISKLKEQNETLQRINGELKAHIIELLKNEEKNNQATLQMQDAWVKEKQQYQSQILELEEQLKKKIELLNEANEMKGIQFSENKQLKQEIAQIKQNQAENESNFASFKEQTVQLIKLLEEHIIELSQEKNSLKEMNEKMSLEMKQAELSAEAVIKQRETQLQAANDLINIQSNKICNLSVQIREQDTRVQKLIETSENRQVQIQQADIKVKDLEAQILDLKKKLEIKDQPNKQDSFEANQIYLFKQGILDQLIENRSILARAIFENISYCMREIHDFIQEKPTKFLVNAYQHIFRSLQQQADRFNSTQFVNSNGAISCADSSKIYPNIQHSGSQLDISIVFLDIHEHLASMLQTVLSLYSEINRQVIQTIN